MDFYKITDIKPDDLTTDHRDIVNEYASSLDNTSPSKAYYLLMMLTYSGKYSDNHKRTLEKKTNKLLRQCASDGDPELQCQLGNFLLYRRIAPKTGMTHVEEAKHWFNKALKQNYPRAAFELSNLYQENRGAHKRDLQKAEEYQDLAAKLGYKA